MKNFMEGSAWVLAVLGISFAVVVGLAAIMPPRGQTEASFRAACASVKGNAVWNGRHWECLK